MPARIRHRGAWIIRDMLQDISLTPSKSKQTLFNYSLLHSLAVKRRRSVECLWLARRLAAAELAKDNKATQLKGPSRRGRECISITHGKLAFSNHNMRKCASYQHRIDSLQLEQQKEHLKHYYNHESRKCSAPQTLAANHLLATITTEKAPQS